MSAVVGALGSLLIVYNKTSSHGLFDENTTYLFTVEKLNCNNDRRLTPGLFKS